MRKARHLGRALNRPRAAAAKIGCHEQTLSRWRRLGIGPQYLRLPTGRVFYTDEALAAFLASCTRSPRRGA